MKKIFDFLLLFCGLLVVLHVAMTVITEREAGARHSLTPEGKANVKAFWRNQVYPNGGYPANSALVLNFGASEDPETLDSLDAPIYFDHENQQRATQTGWIGPRMGFLVFDRDNDGRIDSGRELFGNRTQPGDGHSQTGFEALALEDTNGDGRIDSRDANWKRLQVWRDRNSNGLVDANELFSLDELGIASLELNREQESRFLPEANYLYARGSFTYRDGRRGHLDEVFFQSIPGRRIFKTTTPVPPEIAATVPDLDAGGLVRNLREAAAQSPKLREIFRRYQAANRREQLALLDDLLEAWIAAAGPAPGLEERAAGRYRLIADCLTAADPARQQKIRALEAWTGRSFYSLPHEMYPGQDPNPNVTTANGEDGPELTITCQPEKWTALDQYYQGLSDSVYRKLLQPTRLARMHALVDWRASKIDFSKLLAWYEDASVRDPESAWLDLLDYRLSLALDPRRSFACRALDDYICRRAETLALTPEQERLLDRLDLLKRLHRTPRAAGPASSETPSQAGR